MNDQLLNEFISTILQVTAFTLVPFIAFLFRQNKNVTFNKYIGFYKTSSRAMLYALAIALLFLLGGVALIFIDPGFREIVTSPVSVTGKLRQMGFTFNAVIILLLIALFKTSLSEEILFRGFIAKHLINKLGFHYGNLVQSAIFGLVHMLLVWKLIDTTISGLLLVFVFPASAAWVIGLVKTKFANGSIIPGWLAHGLGNTISYATIAYLI